MAEVAYLLFFVIVGICMSLAVKAPVKRQREDAKVIRLNEVGRIMGKAARRKM